jgi:hypothetical protein
MTGRRFPPALARRRVPGILWKMRAVKPASSIPIGFPAHRNLAHEARDARSLRLPAAPIGTYLYSEFLRNYQRGTAKLPWGAHIGAHSQSHRGELMACGAPGLR